LLSRITPFGSTKIPVLFLIHLLDEAFVIGQNDFALDLERGRQFAGFLTEGVVVRAKTFDLFHASQRLVQFVDRFVEFLTTSGLAISFFGSVSVMFFDLVHLNSSGKQGTIMATRYFF